MTNISHFFSGSEITEFGLSDDGGITVALFDETGRRHGEIRIFIARREDAVRLVAQLQDAIQKHTFEDDRGGEEKNA